MRQFPDPESRWRLQEKLCFQEQEYCNSIASFLGNESPSPSTKESSLNTKIFVADMIPQTQSIIIPPNHNEKKKKNREKAKMEACLNIDSQRNQNPITFTKSSNHLLPSQNYNLKGHM